MGHAAETLLAMRSSLLTISTAASLPHFSRLPCLIIFRGFSLSPVLTDNHICSVQFSIVHYNLWLSTSERFSHSFLQYACEAGKHHPRKYDLPCVAGREVKHGVGGEWMRLATSHAGIKSD